MADSAVRIGDPGPDLYQCGDPTPKGSGPSFYNCPACTASADDHKGQGRGFVVALVIALLLGAAGLGGFRG